MTEQELARYDGQDGRAAYIAVGGTVYDVSTSPYWQNGRHEGLHQAGRDLTQELKSAPHVRAVVERFPVAGRLEKAPPQEKKPGLSLLSIIIMILVLMLLIVTFMR